MKAEGLTICEHLFKTVTTNNQIKTIRNRECQIICILDNLLPDNDTFSI